MGLTTPLTGQRGRLLLRYRLTSENLSRREPENLTLHTFPLTKNPCSYPTDPELPVTLTRDQPHCLLGCTTTTNTRGCGLVVKKRGSPTLAAGCPMVCGGYRTKLSFFQFFVGRGWESRNSGKLTAASCHSPSGRMKQAKHN